MEKKPRIIICGCPLAGKSTIADLICRKHGVSHIPTDGFVTAFEKAFPNFGIGHTIPWDLVSKVLYPFLSAFIRELDDQSTYAGYVIEGYHVDVAQLFSEFGHSHKILVCGYPDATVTQKLERTRSYDVDNWTNSRSDEFMMSAIWEFISWSKKHRDYCLENGIEFLDTSHDWDMAVRDALNRI